MSGLVKTRNEYLDVARGIAIISVVFGHLVLFGGVTYKYIFAFHMPFFFLVSGWCTSMSKRLLPIGKYILHNAKTILIPAVIARIIISLVDMHGMDLSTRLMETFVSPYTEWFLPTLFTAKIFFRLLLELDKHIRSKAVRALVFCSAVLMAPIFVGIYDKLGLHMYVKFPVSFDCVAIALAFIIIGYFAQKIYFSSERKKLSPLEIIVSILCVVGVLVTVYYNAPINICDCSLGDGSFLLLSASVISFFLMFVSSKISLHTCIIKKFLSLFGRNSLLVYIIHRYINMAFLAVIKKTTENEYKFMIEGVPTEYIFGCFFVNIVLLLIILLALEAIKQRINAKHTAERNA